MCVYGSRCGGWVTGLSVVSLACLSEMLVPFQAIIKEVKQFSNKRREIKREIKALAKTVSVMISYANTFDPPFKIIVQYSMRSYSHLSPACMPAQFPGVLQQGRIVTAHTAYKQPFFFSMSSPNTVLFFYNYFN